jgi:hypothetical protein
LKKKEEEEVEEEEEKKHSFLCDTKSVSLRYC